MPEEPSSASFPVPEEILGRIRLGLVAVGHSAKGSQHKENQDMFAVSPTVEGGQLLLVCDGMGGMGKGDIAAQRGGEVLQQELCANMDNPGAAVIEALISADKIVREELCALGTDRPGSTAALVRIKAGFAHIGWVGDSRVYIVRDGEIAIRTRDHSMVQSLVDKGVMEEDEIEDSPLRGMLERSLGGRGVDDAAAEPELLEPYLLAENDWLLVCSDGLWKTVPDATILEVLSSDDGVEKKCETLTELACVQEDRDDVTLVVAQVRGARDDEGLVGSGWTPYDPELDDAPDFESDLAGDLVSNKGADSAEAGGRSSAGLFAAVGVILLVAAGIAALLFGGLFS